MKHIFLLLICAFMAISCTTTEQQAPTYQAEDVEAAVELFRQLMVNPNEEQLQQITADQLTYGHSNGLIESKSTSPVRIAANRLILEVKGARPAAKVSTS